MSRVSIACKRRFGGQGQGGKIAHAKSSRKEFKTKPRPN